MKKQGEYVFIHEREFDLLFKLKKHYEWVRHICMLHKRKVSSYAW